MKTFPAGLRAAFVLTAATLAAGGFWFYKTQERHVRQSVESDLQAISRLKVDEITRWRKERLADAIELSESPFFRDRVVAWLARPAPGVEEKILLRLSSVARNQGYFDILLVNPKGEVRFSLAAQASGPVHKMAGEAFFASLEARRPFLSDLHEAPGALPPHLDVVAPVLGPGGKPVGAVILQADARHVLYPILRSRPEPGNGIETLLIRREGEDVLFLSDLMHRENAALRLRIPLSRTDLPAAMAACGREGIAYGRDYRGVPVVAALKAVPGSSWLLVAKMDEARAFAGGRFRAALILALLLGSLLAVGLAAMALAQRHAKTQYRLLYQAELERRISEERHLAILTSVGDGIVTTDSEGRVELLNPAAEALTGWRQEDAAGRPHDEVLQILDEDTREPGESPLARVLREGFAEGPSSHFILVSRDGAEMPVAISSAAVRGEKGEPSGVVLAFRDQTVDRAKDRALRESEARFRTLVESAPEAIFAQSGGRFLYLNAQMLSLLGASGPEMLLGSEFILRVAPEYRDAVLERIRTQKETGSPAPLMEQVYLRMDGSRVPVETVAVPHRFDGQDAHLVYVRDLSEKKGTEAEIRSLLARAERDRLALLGILEDEMHAREAMRESERFALSTIDALSSHLCVLNGAGTILAVNAAWRKFASANQVIPRNVSEGANYLAVCGAAEGPDSGQAAAFASGIRAILQGEREEFSMEYPCHSPEAERWFVGRVTRFCGEGPPRAVVVHENISERKAASKEIRRQRELIHLAGEIAKVGGWEFDAATLEGAWTDEVARIHDLDPAERPTVTLGLSFYDGESRRKIDAAIQRALEAGEPYDLDLEMTTARGTRKWVRTIGIPITESGRVVKIRGVFQDITDRKQAEKDLASYRSHLEDLVAARTAELEAANREMESFSYSVSHDLCAPVRAMDGFVRILDEEYASRLDAEGLRILHVIRDNSRKMGQLIDDLLRLSRIGRKDLEPSKVDMASLARSVSGEICAAEGGRAEIACGDLPCAIGDAALMRHVWANLLANAVKFTGNRDHPRIEIGGRLEGAEAVYWVRDNGVGFDMRFADKLFGVFQRLHAQEEFPGTGVGLAIVQRIVTRLGGRVWAEGEVGRGATFSFSLPAVK